MSNILSTIGISLLILAVCQHLITFNTYYGNLKSVTLRKSRLLTLSVQPAVSHLSTPPPISLTSENPGGKKWLRRMKYLFNRGVNHSNIKRTKFLISSRLPEISNEWFTPSFSTPLWGMIPDGKKRCCIPIFSPQIRAPPRQRTSRLFLVILQANPYMKLAKMAILEKNLNNKKTVINGRLNSLGTLRSQIVLYWVQTFSRVRVTSFIHFRII